MVEANIEGGSKKFDGHIVYALNAVGHAGVDLESTIFKCSAGAVYDNFSRPIEGAQFLAEFATNLAAIRRIHERESTSCCIW